MISIEEKELELPYPIEENYEEEIQLHIKEVKEAILELPENYRLIMTLFFLEQYSHEEISEMLHISNNLSRTRLVRAKQKVMKMLKEKQLKSSFNYN